MTRFERRTVILELAILALTLIVTTMAGLAVYYQATRHFNIQRTSSMMERFNSKEMVEVRDVADKWLSTGESPQTLMDRAVDPYRNKLEREKTEEERSISAKAKEAADIVRDVRVFCNFFQELGTAYKRGTLDEGYMWDLFGGLVIKYGEELKPFAQELRFRRRRAQLYQEFLSLTEKMKQLNEKYLGE